MIKIKYCCDCCKREVDDDNCLNRVPLPNCCSGKRKRADDPPNYYYCLKEYDFCDDCYKAFGKMMKMCSNTQGVPNPLFKLILSFKDELERGNDNVD